MYTYNKYIEKIQIKNNLNKYLQKGFTYLYVHSVATPGGVALIK